MIVLTSAALADEAEIAEACHLVLDVSESVADVRAAILFTARSD